VRNPGTPSADKYTLWCTVAQDRELLLHPLEGLSWLLVPHNKGQVSAVVTVYYRHYCFIIWSAQG
jgi:hypothetical protein